MTRTKHHSPHYEEGGKGHFDMAYHLEMVSDKERVGQFQRGIDQLVGKDTIFCDLGCGTGVFSIYAAQKARKVYAVEYDENVLDVAKYNIKKSGLSEKVELIHGDATVLTLPEMVDVVFCEMLSIWMIDEPQIIVKNHAFKNILKPNGRTIPEKVINLAELCNTDYVFDNIEVKTSIAQFSGIKRPRIMTESNVFNTFRLNAKNPIEIHDEIEFKALTSGTINSARLSSIVKIAEGVNFYSTDTLMPLTIVPLKNEVYVNEGQIIKFSATYKHRDSLENACFEIR